VLNGKQSIGAHGFVAHFEDTEGNRVALHATS
jgi:predicted enzyme related to lactoylglutathione lyase